MNKATTQLNLPAFDIPQRREWPRMTWEQVMDETESRRQHFMKHFDSPERRLRNKNAEPFRMPRNP